MVEWFRSSKEIGHSILDVEFWHNKGKCELLRHKKIGREKKIDKGLLYLSLSLNVGRFWLSMSFHFNDLKIVTRKNINPNSRSNFTNIIPVSELITFSFCFFWVVLSWILNSNLWFENIQWLNHKIIMCYIGFHMYVWICYSFLCCFIFVLF